MEQNAQSPAPSGFPRRFGNYWLDAQLAEGGMSRVMLARLRGPGGFEKKLVVKQILPQLANDPGFVELFVREANTLVQMSHPNIVPVYELGVIDGVYFLAMERIEGATVAELLVEGPLGEAMCAHVGAQVCEALRYAHERFGLVHRDVTPRNVIVDAGGHVRLLDFGIAAPLAHSTPGELFGSPGHMSPEQARGDALGPQSDLFSLGTVLHEALTGARALSRDVSGTQTAERPKSLVADGGFDMELAALIDQLLEPESAARPKSAAEAAARLRSWLAQRHPEGVAAELGRRAERTRSHGARSSVRPAARGEPEPRHSATPRLTRSIATSPKLTKILNEGTEPLARADRPQATARASARWLPRAVLGGALLLLAAALLLQRQPGVGRRAISTRPQRAPQPLATTPSEIRPRSVDEPATPAPDAGAPHAAARDAPRSTSLQGRAELSVNALPWAELRLDGKPLGATPQRALGLPPGHHVLLLDCPPLGRKARVPLELDPGAHRRVLVDLNTDPPHVTMN